MADTKLEMANIKELVLQKDIEIKILEEQISLKANVVWQEPYYFVTSETDDKDGPYCQKCYDSNNKLMIYKENSDMEETVEVFFDGQVFRPISKVNLIPNMKYILQIKKKETSSENVFDILEKLTGTVEAPEDWALNHDHYLYKEQFIEELND